MDNSHAQKWEACLRIIADNISPEQFDVWFKPVESLGFEDGKLTLAVPSELYVEHIESTFLPILHPTLKRVFGAEFKGLYYHYLQVNNQPDTAIKEAGLQTSPALKRQATGLFQAPAVATFDSQCKTFNPLFVFGPTGVGKTHLIQAIGIKILENIPTARILYVSARLFESQYTVAARNGKINEFIGFYQSIDTLIIDDIQDLIGKEKTQNAFFHIFNHLHQNGKQIILSSDVCPTQLQGMMSRLLSRFKWGMTVELEKPDLALRRAVLRLKAEQDGLSIPDAVLDFIAENVTDTVRELEGIVVSLLAHATLLNREVTVDLARHVMANIVKVHKRTLNFEMITQGVAAHFNIDPDSIFTKSRKREISDARQLVMYLAKKHAGMGLTAIGTRLSRNHATVLYACRNIEERLAFEKKLQEDVAAIEQTFVED